MTTSDYNNLYDTIWEILEKELGSTTQVDFLTDQILDAFETWMPKTGDFMLSKDGMLFVNKGWEAVTSEALE